MKVEFTCQSGHKQVLTFEGMSEEYVRSVCGILDGSSPLYVFPPGQDSVIGKCGICQSPFQAKVLPEEAPPPRQGTYQSRYHEPPHT